MQGVPGYFRVLLAIDDLRQDEPADADVHAQPLAASRVENAVVDGRYKHPDGNQQVECRQEHVEPAERVLRALNFLKQGQLAPFGRRGIFSGGVVLSRIGVFL